MSLKNMIFKYVDCAGFPIVSDGEIRISDPSQVNDPFESIPWINPPSKEMITKKLSEPSFLELATENLLQQKKIACASDAESYLKTNKTLFVNRLYEESRKNPAMNDPQHFRKEISALFGFTSFSETPIDILMWSHYADEHKGFVLGFSPRIFGEEYPREVIYSSHRIEYNSVLDSATRDYLFFKILRTKSSHWAYERELRSMLPWSICNRKNDGHYYHPFPAEDLKCIIFGARCNNEMKDILLQEIETKYPHAEIYTASINEARYHLDLHELIKQPT